VSDKKPVTMADLVRRFTTGVVVAVVLTAGNVAVSGWAIIQSQRISGIEKTNDKQDAKDSEMLKEISANRSAIAGLQGMSDDVKEIKHILLSGGGR